MRLLKTLLLTASVCISMPVLAQTVEYEQTVMFSIDQVQGGFDGRTYGTDPLVL